MKQGLTIIHELSNSGQHRIVLIHQDGTNLAGEWTPVQELARNLDLLANTNPDNGLPLGVFKTRDVTHQVLS